MALSRTNNQPREQPSLVIGREQLDPVGDVFAPFFRVSFITARKTEGIKVVNGEEVINKQPIDGAAESSSTDEQVEIRSDQMGELRAYATSLEVRTVADGVSMATLTLEPPFEDALRIIDNQTIQYDSIMRVEWGWLPSVEGQRVITTEPHYYVVQPPSLSMDRGDVKITFTGSEILAHNMAQREDRFAWDRQKFKSDFDIFEDILKRLGMTANTALVPEDSSFFQAQSEPAKIEQNERTYIFLRRLVRSNNCDYFVVGNVCFVVDKNAAKIARPAYRLVQYQQLRDAIDVPLFSWSTNALPELFTAPAGARGVNVATVDHDANVVSLESFDPAKSSLEKFIGERTRSGRDQPDGLKLKIGDTTITPNLKLRDTEVGRHVAVPSRGHNAAETGRQVARSASFVANTEAQATIAGLPGIYPWQTVRVEGMGDIFSGNYLVSEVVHQLNAGEGYYTNLKLVRDTSTGDRRTGRGVTPKTGANQPQPESKPGQSVQATDQNTR